MGDCGGVSKIIESKLGDPLVSRMKQNPLTCLSLGIKPACSSSHPRRTSSLLTLQNNTFCLVKLLTKQKFWPMGLPSKSSQS